MFGTSGLGGCIGWVVVHPFNTLAVRWNLEAMQNKKFSIKGMIAEQGVLSVYDGLPAAILRQVVYVTSRFGLFEVFRDKLHAYRGKTDFAGR